MPRTSSQFYSVTAFIDWYSQMFNAHATNTLPLTAARLTLKFTTDTIAKLLTSENRANRYTVLLRIYHGWHKGWQPTENLRAIMQTVTDPDFPTGYSTRNVLFRQNVEYGHTLLSALPSRQHDGRQFHLANTLRQRNRHSAPEEKMVDTALAADVMHWARESPSDWALVMAEDDDLVPPVFTAESWIYRRGGKMFIARKKPQTAYLKTAGLLRSW